MPRIGVLLVVWLVSSVAVQAADWGGQWLIISEEGLRALDAESNNDNKPSKDGCPVKIWTVHGNNNQLWKFEKAGEGYFITCVDGGKQLDVDLNKIKDDQALVTLWGNSNNNDKHRQWKLNEEKGGLFTIQNAASGKVLDVTKPNAEKVSNGARLQQYSFGGKDAHNQLWAICRKVDVDKTVTDAVAGILQGELKRQFDGKEIGDSDSTKTEKKVSYDVPAPTIKEPGRMRRVEHTVFASTTTTAWSVKFEGPKVDMGPCVMGYDLNSKRIYIFGSMAIQSDAKGTANVVVERVVKAGVKASGQLKGSVEFVVIISKQGNDYTWDAVVMNMSAELQKLTLTNDVVNSVRGDLEKWINGKVKEKEADAMKQVNDTLKEASKKNPIPENAKLLLKALELTVYSKK